MNSSEKGEEVPLLNFEGGPGVPLLNFEGGPGSRIPGSRCAGFWGPGPTLTSCQINQCPQDGDVAEKNTFSTEHLPLADSPISVYFLLELKNVDMCLKKKKTKFYKETLKKTPIILYRTRTSSS